MSNKDSNNDEVTAAFGGGNVAQQKSHQQSKANNESSPFTAVRAFREEKTFLRDTILYNVNGEELWPSDSLLDSITFNSATTLYNVDGEELWPLNKSSDGPSVQDEFGGGPGIDPPPEPMDCSQCDNHFYPRLELQQLLLDYDAWIESRYLIKTHTDSLQYGVQPAWNRYGGIGFDGPSVHTHTGHRGFYQTMSYKVHADLLWIRPEDGLNNYPSWDGGGGVIFTPRIYILGPDDIYGEYSDSIPPPSMVNRLTRMTPEHVYSKYGIFGDPAEQSRWTAGEVSSWGNTYIVGDSYFIQHPTVSQGRESVTFMEHEMYIRRPMNLDETVDAPINAWDMFCNYISAFYANIQNLSVKNLSVELLNALKIEVNRTNSMETFTNELSVIDEYVDDLYTNNALTNNALINKSYTNRSLTIESYVDQSYVQSSHNVTSSSLQTGVAEYYTSDSNYPPGTVVCFGGAFEVQKRAVIGDGRVAGVVVEVNEQRYEYPEGFLEELEELLELEFDEVEYFEEPPEAAGTSIPESSEQYHIDNVVEDASTFFGPTPNTFADRDTASVRGEFGGGGPGDIPDPNDPNWQPTPSPPQESNSVFDGRQPVQPPGVPLVPGSQGPTEEPLVSLNRPFINMEPIEELKDDLLELEGLRALEELDALVNWPPASIKENPALLMNSDLPNQSNSAVVAVALLGRVKCIVSGKIRKGDRLVADGMGGARSADVVNAPGPSPYPAATIGKALEDNDALHAIIEIVVWNS